jgi:hypothetical protein
MVRSFQYALATLVLGCIACFAGCYAGANDKVFCDQYQSGLGPCFNDKVYQECLNCYDTCGDVCQPVDSCPTKFTCNPK